MYAKRNQLSDSESDRCRRPWTRAGTWAVLLATVVLPSVSWSQGDRLVGEGDFETYLDAAGLRAENGLVEQHFFVGVPDKVLEWRQENGFERAKIRFTIRVKGGGKKALDETTEMTFERNDSGTLAAAVRTRLIRRSALLEPGLYDLTYKVEDLFAPRHDLLGRIKKAHLESGVENLRIGVKAIPEDGLGLSDLLFCIGAKEGVLPRGPEDVTPYPSREYGVVTDALLIFAVVYVPAAHRETPVLARYKLKDQSGTSVFADSLRLQGGETIRPLLVRLDINRLPAGLHIAEVELIAPEIGYLNYSGSFDVVWDIRSLFMEKKDVLAEARILLKNSEYKTFSEMGRGEQEAFMKEFWKKLDPTPHTAENERYNAFKARMFYADREFAGLYRGSLSDRGIIYIRFGAPSEILQEEIPLNRESTKEALQVIEDKYSAFLNTTSSDYAVFGYSNVPRPVIESEASRVGRAGGGSDAGAFEVWIYDMSGDPLLPQDVNLNVDTGLRFIFIDNQGYGHFELSGSSVQLDF